MMWICARFWSGSTLYKMVAFVLSCGFAGLLGTFYAYFVGILTPDVMGTQHTVEVIALM